MLESHYLWPCCVDIPGSDNMSFTLLVVSVGVCLHGCCDVCKCNRSDSYACTEQ